MAVDYSKLLDYDQAPLRELDRRVDDDVHAEVDGRKRNIEEARAKKRKKAAKKARKSTDGGPRGRA